MDSIKNTADKIAFAVYETYDYSKFKKMEGNRAVVNRRKTKILKSIEKVGYVNNPIIVNKNFEIIDGQGRFEACKELGLPIQYVIDQDAGLEECIALNLGQTNWTPMDYVRSYAEQGLNSYVRLLRLLERHPSIGLQVMYGVVTNTINTGGAGTRTLRDGDLDFSAEWGLYIEKSIIFIEENLEELKLIKGEQRVLQSGIAWVINNTNVDVKRLGKIIKTKYPLIHAVVHTDTFLTELEDLYNKKLSAEKCIYFSTEFKKSLKEA